MWSRTLLFTFRLLNNIFHVHRVKFREVCWKWRDFHYITAAEQSDAPFIRGSVVLWWWTTDRYQNISGFRTTCGHGRNNKRLKFPCWAAKLSTVKANSVLKQVQACYATSDTLFIFNGGPADELWYREALRWEQRLLFSMRFGLRQRSPRDFEQQDVEEMANEVHLLYSAIYFKGKVYGYLATDKNPSELSYQVASGHTHTRPSTRVADNKSLLALPFQIQSRQDLKAAKRLWWLKLFTSHFPPISPPAACVQSAAGVFSTRPSSHLQASQLW